MGRSVSTETLTSPLGEVVEMTIQFENRTRVAQATASKALRFLPVTSAVLDVVVVTCAGVLAFVGRSHFHLFDRVANISDSVTTIGPLALVIWLGAISAFGGHRSDVFGAGTDEYKRVLNASLATAGALGVGCYLTKFDLSRGFFLLAFGLGTPALLLGRLLLRRALHRARRQGLLQYRTIIAGTVAHVDEIATALGRETWLGYHVEGALVPGVEFCERTRLGVPVLGTTEEVTEVVCETGVDVIFFAGGSLRSPAQLRNIAWDLEREDIQVIVAPSVTDVSAERVRVRPVGGLPLMHLDSPRATDASSWGKRLFDIMGSLMLLLVFSPVFLVTALAIKLDDGGPVFFSHRRVGRHGREFGCLKFRTMVTNAEELVRKLQEERGQSALLFKLKNDPRITRVGDRLRRYSVDELPQLLNVLRGDMSLVGPRPQVAAEVAMYEGPMARRLHVRPGMTGLWQVSGRNDLTLSEAIRLDLYYVDNWSLVQDLSILSKTFGAVFGSRGAY